MSLSLRELYKPNQYLFHVKSPYTKKPSIPTTYTETTTLDFASSTSSYVTQTDLSTTTTAIFSKLDDVVKNAKNLTETITYNDENVLFIQCF